MKFLSNDDPRREVWELCESPIEQCLCCALLSVVGCRAVFGPFGRSRLPHLAEIGGDAPACFLFAQHSIGAYRADFLLVTINPQARTDRRLIIECDGEKYHGSDEQIARDQRRDDEIKELGYRIFRYPGAAIHGRMPEILDEIREWLAAGGVVCPPSNDLSDYGGFLLSFMPDRRARLERRAAREVYWREQNREHQATFVDELGLHYQWADTL